MKAIKLIDYYYFEVCDSKIQTGEEPHRILNEINTFLEDIDCELKSDGTCLWICRKGTDGFVAGPLFPNEYIVKEDGEVELIDKKDFDKMYRPMPEKEMILHFPEYRENDYAQGWNNCIDEILEEKI